MTILFPAVISLSRSKISGKSGASFTSASVIPWIWVASKGIGRVDQRVQQRLAIRGQHGDLDDLIHGGKAGGFGIQKHPVQALKERAGPECGFFSIGDHACETSFSRTL